MKIRIETANKTAFVDALLDAYEQDVIKNNTGLVERLAKSNYLNFIKKFELDNNLTVIGRPANKGSSWRTTAIEFNSEEDLIVFKLKYGL